MIPLRIKGDVVITKLQPQLVDVLPAIGEVFQQHGANEYVITSGEEGQHMPGSLHYAGCALDFRNWVVSQTKVPMVVADLRARLGAHYDVVSEATHIHIEYDPK